MTNLRRPLIPLAVLTLVVSGCGWKRTGTNPKDELGDGNSIVELTLTSVTREQAQQFIEDLDDYGDVDRVELKSFNNGTAVYEVEIDGCECDFPAMMAEIPEPGFRYMGRTSKIRYAAFDNQPPKVKFLRPENGAVVREKEIEVAVEVPDEDVKEVSINGRAADRSGTTFTTRIRLGEGANDLIAVAKDATGNEGKAQIRVGLDSTPPEVSANVTVVIEGDVEPGTRVIVNGDEVPVDSRGHYEAKVRVKSGQKEVEIIAIDPYGNRTETMRPIGK